MYRIILAAFDIIPAAVVLIPLFGILYITVYDRNFRKCVLYCLFCLYLSAVFALVGIPNISYIRPEVNLNLVPFVGMIQDFKNSILNVLLFIPLGFFLPILCGRFGKLIPNISFGFGLSLVIELLQMLTFRATDVNDLITNSIGTILGFLLAKAAVRNCQSTEDDKKAIYLLCVLSFIIMFFVHPFLSTLIWDRIL